MSTENEVSSNMIRANVVHILDRSIQASEIHVVGSQIRSIIRVKDGIDETLPYALPGFIDAHIHIESSMLTPAEFARMASVHGTVATVSDPHEIANVLGVEGVEYMIQSGKTVPMKFCFGAPSCVPATEFETSGASIDAAAIAQLLDRDDIGYLAEMMNYPGVLTNDAEVTKKIKSSLALGKPVDGHAPGLRGDHAVAYIAAGISTDHECTSFDEAIHKLRAGMKILIREGSAAKNYEALKSLIDFHPEQVMLCSDDKHPDELATGHIDRLVARAVRDGIDLFNVLRAACWNPVDHYSLKVGRLREGDLADFILVRDLIDFRVSHCFIDGVCVAQHGVALFTGGVAKVVNRFDCQPKQTNDFRILANVVAKPVAVRVIEAVEGELVTDVKIEIVPCKDGFLSCDLDCDVLKIAVVNRYQTSPVAIAFIHGFGLKRGAIASSVGHDSHNVLAVGTDDDSLCRAINEVISHRGGIVAVSGDASVSLPLPIAGIISDQPGEVVAQQYALVDAFAKDVLGSTLKAPFMTLSFMALLVIPKLKLSDRGLFDGEQFRFVDVIVDSPSRVQIGAGKSA